jgi:hypothetical protein
MTKMTENKSTTKPWYQTPWKLILIIILLVAIPNILLTFSASTTMTQQDYEDKYITVPMTEIEYQLGKPYKISVTPYGEITTLVYKTPSGTVTFRSLSGRCQHITLTK